MTVNPDVQRQPLEFRSLDLRPLELEYRDELFALVELNRAYLREWLPWLDGNVTVEDTERFLKTIEAQNQRGDGAQYGLFYRSKLCGVCGFHEFDKTESVGRIGYWLDQGHTGLGIVTWAVKKLLSVGFEQHRLNKIEIRCALNNSRSRNIPERLGFYLEDIKPNAEYLYDHFVDHAIYSLLLPEYQVQRADP